jgi:hypothetical protein
MATKVKMADRHEDEQAQAFAQQLQTAMDAIREAVGRLLQAGEVDPRVIALAVAAVAGELGASMARAGEGDLDTLLRDLGEVMQHVGQEHTDLIDMVTMPAAGSA